MLEAGAYGIYVGTDVRSAKKVCEVQLDELCVISRLEEALAPVQPYERLVPVETGKKGTDGEPVLEIGKQDSASAERRFGRKNPDRTSGGRGLHRRSGLEVSGCL